MNVETYRDAGSAPVAWRAAARRRRSRAAAVRTRMAWTAAARIGMAASTTALLMTVLLGTAAPNANTAAVRGPLSVLAPLPPVLSYPAAWLSTVLAGLGLGALLLAYARGWRPDPGRLLMLSAGAVALLVNLTPVGSSDTASYAAYGRLFATGTDPYEHSPASLGGPYASVVASDWLHTPSVYGPFATFAQAAAARLGADDPATTIWLLMVAGGAMFLLVGGLLVRIAAEPSRAALLWAANPLLIQQLVGGGHIDVFVVAAAVAAVFLARRCLPSGMLVGVGCGFKANAALVGAGLVWERLRRRDHAGLVRLTAGAGAVVAAAYLTVGREALGPLFEATSLAGADSPWSLVTSALGVMDRELAAAVTRFGWPFALVVVAVLLLRKLPEDAPHVVRTQFALALAWVLVAPWIMPWYTALAWGFHAQLPATRLTRWLIAYTVVMGCLHNSGGHTAG
ncbi:glycosyltransferase 87 family protein [Actinomadura alba]|uniref:DUF2029 domain-containing protein n=1 Tax=Actinomadura alba TaxID=406431 RepID=A0ABR7LNU3_9ACTN|nr:glycosyltransferase 87 family protein [Actinomadura alba]MBC6466229.1 DUF2029 domain-containing protein [Actinomadura alba]